MVPIGGWVTTGPMTAWTYGALGDRPDQSFAASINGGANFFSGGPGGIAGTPTASQRIDVAGAAAEIDLGDVAATLSAYIGGHTVPEICLRSMRRPTTPPAPGSAEIESGRGIASSESG